uniref:Calcium uniporter protein C-terminal domain-containing protein n=1 Tax=Trypanosoma congolense (strain IL3000) TaxID=1068625 RepID=G0UZC6_TRYCI|nr:conserved hypothetical protein [Trypanosoma congolense IL3000]
MRLPTSASLFPSFIDTVQAREGIICLVVPHACEGGSGALEMITCFTRSLLLRTVIRGRACEGLAVQLGLRYASTVPCDQQHQLPDGDVRSPSVGLTAAEFSRTAPLLLLTQVLRRHAVVGRGAEGGESVITREVFDRYCRECHIEDSSRALELLCESATVVSISDGAAVHLRPAQFLQGQSYVTGARGLGEGSQLEVLLHEARCRLTEAEAEERELRLALQPAIQKAVGKRRLVWAAAFCFTAVQLATVSRLTFFDLDWDIMEPVSYFLGAGTTIILMFYLIRLGHVKKYSEYEEKMAAARVRRYAPTNFDWKKYEAAVKRVEEERHMVERMSKWFNQH